MTDLPLYLPAGVYLKALTISPDFNIISEVMQRALVLLICHDDQELMIDGKSVIEFLEQATTAGVSSAVTQLSDIADTLKKYLNTGYSSTDGVTTTADVIVSSVYFEAEVTENAAIVNLVINQSGKEAESTTVYKYE